jgi:hypothetical protein
MHHTSDVLRRKFAGNTEILCNGEVRGWTWMEIAQNCDAKSSLIILSGGIVPEDFCLLSEACPRIIMYVVWIHKIFMLMTRQVTGVCPSPWTCNTCVLSPTSGFSWLVERCTFIVVRSLPARYRSSETSTTTKGEETGVATSREKFQLLVVVTVLFR